MLAAWPGMEYVSTYVHERVQYGAEYGRSSHLIRYTYLTLYEREMRNERSYVT